MNPATPSTPSTPSIDRRRLLRDGTLALSLGAIVAACGSERGGPEAPGRIGVGDTPAKGPDTTVDDVVLLRTAQSLEHTLLEMYGALSGAGPLGGSVGDRLVADHTRHAAEIGALIGGQGGQEFACANPFLTERAVTPIVAAVEGSDDADRDALHVAYAFEELAGRTYQALVTALELKMLRSEAMRIGGEEHRHAAGLAGILNPGAYYDPAMAGFPGAESDADGFPVRYAIPATFGQLTGISLVVGAADDEGARYETTLQTPAANSLVYTELSC